jgi:hypothetical protein
MPRRRRPPIAMAAMGRIELTRDLTAKFDLGFNLKTAKIFGLTIA